MDALQRKIAGIDKLLTPAQVADILGVKVMTLTHWRHHKRYALNFVRVGRSIRYRKADVERFIKTRTVEVREHPDSD